MKIYYIQSTKSFSISEPISSQTVHLYKIIYVDKITKDIKYKSINATTQSEAYNKFMKSDHLKNSNIVPTDIRLFQIPSQIEQSEEYKNKLKEKLKKDINQ